MSTNFPHHKFCPRPRYAWYVHACMQVVHLSRASFEGPVLAMLADGALDMDVEIKIRDGGAVALTTPPPRPRRRRRRGWRRPRRRRDVVVVVVVVVGRRRDVIVAEG